MHFPGAAVVKDGIGARRGVITATAASELRILNAGQKCRRHRYSLESGSGNVVCAESTAHQRPIALIGLELNPRRFVLNFLETVRRFAVKREHLARLRVQNNNGAVLSF